MCKWLPPPFYKVKGMPKVKNVEIGRDHIWAQDSKTFCSLKVIKHGQVTRNQSDQIISIYIAQLDVLNWMYIITYDCSRRTEFKSLSFNYIMLLPWSKFSNGFPELSKFNPSFSCCCPLAVWSGCSSTTTYPAHLTSAILAFVKIPATREASVPLH